MKFIEMPASDQQTLPRVRVGIVTRNRATILPLAIQSALEQDYSKIEVSVIDDGSSDGTDNVRAMFPQITWYHNPAPRGCIEARNQLMSVPGADLFVSLDDDSWFLERDAISIGVRAMRETGAAAIAYDILDDRNRQQHVRTEPKQVHTFIGCGHMVDLQRAQSAGLYQPMPGSYGGEEKDFCLRLLDAGGTVLLLPGVHVWHDKTMNARDVTGQHQSGVCNDLVSTWTRCPTAYLPGLLFAKIARHLDFAFSFALRRWDRLDQFEKAVRATGGRLIFIVPALRGIARALRLIPQLLGERAAVAVRTWHTFKSLSRKPPAMKAATDFPLHEVIQSTAHSPETDTVAVAITARPRIAAIIAAYNRRQQTLDTLARLKSCEPAPDEIWVHVDGGMRDLAAAVEQAHPDVRVFVSDTKLGPGGARNRLLENCACSLVASFDDDSYPLDKDYFTRVRQLAAKWPEVAVFSGELCIPGMIPRPAQENGSWVGSFLGGACVYSRPAFDDQLRYLPLPVAYGMEEMDLGIRLCAKRQKIMHTPWLRVYHDNDSNLHKSSEITAASIANQALFAYLRYPLVAMPLGLLQVISRVLWLVHNRRISGIMAGLGSIPGVLWRHRFSRSKVKMSDIRRFFALRRNATCFTLESVKA